jgi:2-polyprenyl-6-methoxyphenol hydroxylase-like FAD-dependent oxidoreductase
MEILIAGGGLVGLTAAALLNAAGHETTVFEQAPEIRAAGAGIGLWENALRVLDRIGPVRDLGEEIDLWFFDPDGRRVRAAEDRFRLVPRPELNTLLASAAGRIVFEARVTGFEERADRVAARLADGSSVEADLLIGADGAFSPIRTQLLGGYAAQPHPGHHAWRAVVPSGDERASGTVLTVGRERTRGGHHRVAADRTMWMVNQFDAGPLTGSKRDRALTRARNLAGPHWHQDLLRLIERTPEDAILENQIMLVPPLPRWTGRRVALIGDAAHALSPHISAGGTLGIEDAGVLSAALKTGDLVGYERARRARFDRVREFSAAVEAAATPAEYAERYAAFTRWMLAEEASI